MKYIGAHVGTADGIAAAPLEAQSIGARAFAFYTGGDGAMFPPAPTPQACGEFRENCRKLDFTPAVILPHANLYINMGSPDARKLALARKSLLAEMRRCEMLGLTLLNVHAGSHLREIGVEECLDRIAESINLALAQTKGVTILVENAAGQGSNVGASFAELAHIVARVEDKTRVGVCVDTCHAWAAGYDLADADGYRAVWEEFDDTVGAGFLRALHLNDAREGLGSRKDRHAPLGRGALGPECFRRIVNDPRFDEMPIILETPDPSLWPLEISWLYSLVAA